MDRLRREWRETIIPEEVRLRARSLAWAKIQHRDRGGKRLLWAAAISATVALAALVWMWSGIETRIAQVPAVTPSKISRPATVTVEAVKPHVETPKAIAPKPVDKQAAKIQAEEVLDIEPERIVLNFILPDSGARMIWIMDSRYNFDGGVE